jgi:tripartite ATP-independent transporter DctM subunit
MESGVLIGLLLFLLGILIGLPLCWVFLGSTFATIVLISGSTSFMAGTFYHAIDNYVLMAIAFFIFAGSLLSVSGIADRIIRFSYALVGRVPGGLVDVGIVAAVFMGALTGSSLPVIGALIPLLVPRLERYGFRRVYTAAVLCSSSFLGYLIPPSVPGLLYCLVAQQSVAAVFLSTVIPGLILAFGYILVNTFMCRRYMQPAKDIPVLPTTFRGSMVEIGRSFYSAIPALGCPFVVLVGIYAGIFTPNEAGAVAVVYTAAVGLWVYQEMTFTSMWGGVKSSLVTLGMITLLLGFGTVFTRLLIREGLAQAMTDFVLGISQNKYAILLMMNILLLILGMFIDGIPILIITVPLLVPIAQALGVNLVHLGAVIVFNVGLGVVTPPYAISIFVGTRLADVPYGEMVPPMMVFLFLVGIPTLMLTTYIPWLSLWLPTLIMGRQVVGVW